MTPAERVYRAALLAYPKAYRRERGLEILTTILDGGDHRWPRVRELVGVVLDGIERRAHLAGGGSRAGSGRAGVRLAAFVWLWALAVVSVTYALYPGIGAEPIGGGPTTLQSAVLLVLGVAPVLALARSWWYGPLFVSIAATTLSAIGVPWDATWPWEVGGYEWRGSALLMIGFAPGVACILARPRRDEPGSRPSAWVVPAAILVGAGLASQSLFFSSWLGRPVGVALVAALLLARRDPRLAVAAGSLASLAATELLLDPNSVVWLGAGSLLPPLLIALALCCAWRLRPAVA
jgi:hypothetical protein